MKYIVWREPYKSYNIPQGGYFVSYKDKCSDNFSNKWFDAKKYTSLGAAISRLGIYGLECATIESLISANVPRTNSAKRDFKISKILDNKIDIFNIITWRGRIDKVDDDGNFLGDATKDVIDFIENKLKSNNNKFKNKIKLTGGTGDYIDKSETDSEFWNEWIKS